MCAVRDDFEALGLLDGVSDEHERSARLTLLSELREAGVPEDELRRAVALNQLVLLGVDLALARGTGRYTLQEVSERSGLELEFLERVNLALGRPLPEPDVRAFDDGDVQAAANVRLSREAGLPDEGMLEIARVIGLGMANVASTLAGVFGAAFLRAGDTEYDLASRYAEQTHELMPLLEPGLGHALRIHLRSVLRQLAVGGGERATGRLPGAAQVTVAFADLTGFTRLGEIVPADELGALAERFAELVTDLAEPPVRLVKTIGDAAMLVSPDTDALLAALLDLNDAAEDETRGLPPIHTGAARGPSLARGGDWYGAAVNQASRIASFARPGSVVASADVREAARGDYAWSTIGRRRLKGLAEPVALFRLRRPAPEQDDAAPEA
jgi:adenylate cyclase